MANPFVHVELGTTDIAKAKSFYQALFAWKLDDVDMGGGHTYTTIGVGDGTGGGMMKHPGPRRSLGLAALCAGRRPRGGNGEGEEAGCQGHADVTPVMDMGALSIIIDPTGAALGLWEPKAK